MPALAILTHCRFRPVDDDLNRLSQESENHESADTEHMVAYSEKGKVVYRSTSSNLTTTPLVEGPGVGFTRRTWWDALLAVYSPTRELSYVEPRFILVVLLLIGFCRAQGPPDIIRHGISVSVLERLRLRCSP